MAKMKRAIKPIGGSTTTEVLFTNDHDTSIMITTNIRYVSLSGTVASLNRSLS